MKMLTKKRIFHGAPQTDEKRILCEFTPMQLFESPYLPTANTQKKSVKQNCSELLPKFLKLQLLGYRYIL